MEFVRTLTMVLAALSFVIVIGGAVYEHAAVVPVWASAVPASLTMFQGDYGLAAQRFWIPAHPITLLLFVVALVTNWRTTRRVYIIAAFVGYIAVLVTTFLWFVPELIAITMSPYSSVVDLELTRRARAWETFSLMRLAFLLVLAVVLLLGLSKSAETETAA